MNRILIMSVTAGEGHNSTARAMKAYFDSKGAKCAILDVYKYSNPAVGKIVADGYLFFSSKTKQAFRAGYRIAEKRRGGSGEQSMTRLFHTQFSQKIYRYIENFAPDVIMFTNPLAGLITDIIDQRHSLSARVVGVLTDFVFHPYWEDCLCCDYVVTASPMLTYQAKQKGFSEDQILPLGIPISQKFAKNHDKRDTRLALGLDPDKNTILIMGGSMGYGHITKTVEDLDRLELPGGLQMICVCGRSEETFDKVDGYRRKKSRHKILNLGFVDYVDRLMDAADVLISKPGGLTTSEALAKRLPLIIVNPIPGQEQRNTSFLLNNGAAMASSSVVPVDELVYGLFTDPERKAHLLDSIEALRKPESTKNVCDFVLNMSYKESEKETK